MTGYNHLRIKENARTHYRTNTGLAIAVALIATISANFLVILQRVNRYSSGGGAGLGLFLIAAGIFVFNIVQLGAAGWFQKSIYRENLSVSTMFDGFRKNYLDNVVTMLLKNVFIFLWSLLFLVPGIVKSYSYRMTEYIKSENPDVAPRRAIDMSITMTNGFKGDLFYLDLSFLGWFILSLLTVNILGIVYVFPYYHAAIAFAYEELKANALSEGKLSAAEFVPSGTAIL